jgi:hypothetical protein
MKDRRIGGALAVAGVSLLCTIHGNATLAPWPPYRDAAIVETPSAQTGYMQGAAGIGMWLLRLDAAGRGRTTFVRFPDTPWPRP